MDRFKMDFHIHTEHLKCANATMTVKALIAECSRLGLERIAITDHLNHFDFIPKHKLILDDLKQIASPLDIYWAVELNFMACDGEFAFNDQVKADMGYQFAVGGIHNTYLEPNQYDLKKIVDIQHRHHLKVCANPLVEVLVHPYWFGKGEYSQKGFPWFDTMKAIPESYAQELGQTARQTNTAIEINGHAILNNPAYNADFRQQYKDFLQIIAAQGPKFTFGSDAHDISHLQDILLVIKTAEEIGISSTQLWLPPMPPFIEKSTN